MRPRSTLTPTLSHSHARSLHARPQAKIKHDGHTISVSDIWFVAHHMGKLTTHSPATLDRMAPDGCVLSDGTLLPCDVVVGCIGFERNTTFCEQLTGRDHIMHSNYLDKNMIYLADAEVMSGASTHRPSLTPSPRLTPFLPLALSSRLTPSPPRCALVALLTPSPRCTPQIDETAFNSFFGSSVLEVRAQPQPRPWDLPLLLIASGPPC